MTCHTYCYCCFYSVNTTESTTSSSNAIVIDEEISTIPTVAGKKSWFQKPLYNNGQMHESSTNKIDVAIAKLIHARTLPFDLADDPLFHKMITLIRNSSSKYVPPNRNIISGELLESIYKTQRDETRGLLLESAKTFGLAIFGDGATITKVPLMNILAAGVHEPHGLLDIIDCTDHMAEGGVKDAAYISELILPLMRELDPMKVLFDMNTFDGAKNVQVAGELIEKHFPMTTTVHCGEHVVSLLFSDVFNYFPFQVLSNFSKRVSNSSINQFLLSNFCDSYNLTLRNYFCNR